MTDSRNIPMTIFSANTMFIATLIKQGKPIMGYGKKLPLGKIFAVTDGVITGFFVTALYFAAFMFFRKDFNKILVIFSSFICFFCLWQLEVPQKIVFDIAKKALENKVMKEVFIENIDENATFLMRTKTLLDCEDKNIACPFFSFKYPIYDIKARTDGKVRIDGKEKLVGRIYGIAYSTSTLTRLTGFDYIKRLRYFTNISK